MTWTSSGNTTQQGAVYTQPVCVSLNYLSNLVSVEGVGIGVFIKKKRFWSIQLKRWSKTQSLLDFVLGKMDKLGKKEDDSFHIYCQFFISEF